jgi:hypothetical protein
MAMARLQLASHTGTAAKRMLREEDASSSGAPPVPAGSSSPVASAFSQMLTSVTPATKNLDREADTQRESAGSGEAERAVEFDSLGAFGLKAAAAHGAGAANALSQYHYADTAIPATGNSDRAIAAQPENASNTDANARRTFEFESLGTFGMNAAAAARSGVASVSSQQPYAGASLASLGASSMAAQSVAGETRSATPKAANMTPAARLEADRGGQSAETDAGEAVSRGPTGAATDNRNLSSVNGSYSGESASDADPSDASEGAMTVTSVRSIGSVPPGAQRPSAAIIVDVAMGDETNETGGMAALPPVLKEQTPDTPAVFVFGPDEAAQVAVRVPNAAGNAGVIREAIERTAAEYGVRLDELHINGSVSLSTFSLKGNSRGRNTR